MRFVRSVGADSGARQSQPTGTSPRLAGAHVLLELDDREILGKDVDFRQRDVAQNLNECGDSVMMIMRVCPMLERGEDGPRGGADVGAVQMNGSLFWKNGFGTRLCYADRSEHSVAKHPALGTRFRSLGRSVRARTSLP